MSIDSASVVEWDNVSKPEHYIKEGSRQSTVSKPP